MKISFKHFALVVLWLVPWQQCRSQTIRGSVFAENEAAFSACIFLKRHNHVNAFAVEEGRFELTLPEGVLPDTLMVTLMGYKDFTLPLGGQSLPDSLHIMLQPHSISLSEVTIMADATSSKEFAVTKLSRLEVLMNPSASADPLKAVAMMAYSTPTTESANPELRGSSSAFSRVVVNGVPIYNPVRNQQLDGIGNFSLFNVDIVGQQFVYPSNPPLEYGNATAGIVNIRTTYALPHGASTRFSVSLANVGAFHGAGLGRHGFVQTYANVQSSELYRAVNAKLLNHLKSFRSADVGLNLHTQLSKVVHLNLFSYYVNERYAADRGIYNYRGQQNAANSRNFNIVNLGYRAGQRNTFALNLATDVAKANYTFGSIDDHTRQFSTFASMVWKHSRCRLAWA